MIPKLPHLLEELDAILDGKWPVNFAPLGLEVR
jgi:hypothetical protein